MGLTVKQESFCNYYLECGNASEAYRRAYSCKKMKDETINRTAFDLLNNHKVAARLKELRAEMQRRSDITKDEVVGILADIARANVVDAIESRTNGVFTTVVVKDVTALPLSLQRAILSIKSTDKGYELKMYNKIDAIDKLSKMFGWDAPIKEDVSLNKNDAITIQVIDKREDVIDVDTDD